MLIKLLKFQKEGLLLSGQIEFWKNGLVYFTILNFTNSLDFFSCDLQCIAGAKRDPCLDL